jgi:hypothetical protein
VIFGHLNLEEDLLTTFVPLTSYFFLEEIKSLNATFGMICLLKDSSLPESAALLF